MGYGKMANRYQSAKDLQDRLDSTICRYDGTPVFVRVRGDGLLQLYRLQQLGEMQTVFMKITPDDPNFDISSPELGYVNYLASPSPYNPDGMSEGESRAFYSMRHPVRRYKQGLNEQSTFFYRIDGSGEGQHNQILFSSSMNDSLIGNFPTFKEALKILEEGTKSVAISQSLAFERIPSGLTLVYHRCRNVGWIHPGGERIIMKRSVDSWIYERLIGAEKITHA